MREIKFRAWEVFDEKMIYHNSINYEYCIANHGCEVILMQYTGLKDKNGKEIYEGDILEYTVFYPVTGKQVFRNEVVFDSGKGAWGTEYLDGEFHYFGSEVYLNACEVIGNIYENASPLTV
jgi:uncharacterized phage protein (TIGR01671 family)